MCAHAPHVFNVITPLGPGPGDRQFDDDSPGVISRGNAVPIVKVFKNALWTALRTIFWRKCTRLQDFACTVSKRFRCEGFPVLGPRQQFSPCSPAFPLFLFYEMTTADSPDIRVCVCVCVCVHLQISETVETLDCSECGQLSQEAFISIARTPIVLRRLRLLVVPSELTLPNAVFETLANSDCLPLLQCIDNIQPGSSVCDPLRCQVHTSPAYSQCIFQDF